MAWKGRSGSGVVDVPGGNPVVIPASARNALGPLIKYEQNADINTGATWPAASRAFLVPVWLDRSFIADRLGVYNGTVVAGNFDIGIYDSTFARLVSTGAFALAGTSVIQWVNIADTTLARGWYYLAGSPSATPNIASWGYSAGEIRMVGGLQMTAAHPLPATIVPEVVASAFLPQLLISARSV